MLIAQCTLHTENISYIIHTYINIHVVDMNSLCIQEYTLGCFELKKNKTEFLYYYYSLKSTSIHFVRIESI